MLPSRRVKGYKRQGGRGRKRTKSGLTPRQERRAVRKTLRCRRKADGTFRKRKGRR